MKRCYHIVDIIFVFLLGIILGAILITNLLYKSEFNSKMSQVNVPSGTKILYIKETSLNNQ